MSPCIIDWNLLGIWAQVGATVILGGIAIAQLWRFVDSDKAKTTIEVVNAYDRVQHQISEGSMFTPAMAYTVVMSLLKFERNLTWYKSAATIVNSPNVSRKLQDEEDARYRKLHDSWALVANYFTGVAVYRHYHKIDDRVILDFYGPQLLNTWRLLELIADTEPGAKRSLSDALLRDFIKFAKKAERLGKHGFVKRNATDEGLGDGSETRGLH